MELQETVRHGLSPQRCVSTAIGAQEGGVTCLIKRASRQCENGLGCIGFIGRKPVAVEFKKQNAHHKAGSFVAIDEGMVAHDSRRISGGEVDQVGSVCIGMNLLRSGERGFQQGVIPHPRRAAVEG